MKVPGPLGHLLNTVSFFLIIFLLQFTGGHVAQLIVICCWAVGWALSQCDLL